ncbi:MAG: acetylglutamate kinase [Actinobacteria bacterium]|nr:acetylglutamate kinase [Actinomycetota bacterium]
MKNQTNKGKIPNKEIEFYNDNENKIESVYLNKAQVLLEALPYIKEYFDKTVVVKIGGSMMEDDRIMQNVLDDIILMKYVGMKIILVHGGGKQITELMEEKKIKVEFVDGLRVTSKETIDVVKMVLIGGINTKIVSMLNKHGDLAIGLSGNDANFIQCNKKTYRKNGEELDLGYVGEIVNIDENFINRVLNNGYIPVIATLGTDAEGNIYNINADSCASEIALSLKALKMILLTDVDGIIMASKKETKLISRLSAGKCIEMIEKGEISSGMIPKVKACINSLKGGVAKIHILNGTTEHSILIEVFTDKGIGTMITL